MYALLASLGILSGAIVVLVMTGRTRLIELLVLGGFGFLLATAFHVGAFPVLFASISRWFS